MPFVEGESVTMHGKRGIVGSLSFTPGGGTFEAIAHLSQTGDLLAALSSPVPVPHGRID